MHTLLEKKYYFISFLCIMQYFNFWSYLKSPSFPQISSFDFLFGYLQSTPPPPQHLELQFLMENFNNIAETSLHGLVCCAAGSSWKGNIVEKPVIFSAPDGFLLRNCLCYHLVRIANLDWITHCESLSRNELQRPVHIMRLRLRFLLSQRTGCIEFGAIVHMVWLQRH